MLIEVGQTYITHNFDKDEPDPLDLVKIIGEVPSNMEEYKNPLMRYYSDQGKLYGKDGTTASIELAYVEVTGNPLPHNAKDRDLLRLAEPEDFGGGHGEKLRVDLNVCESSTQYISNDHPDFRIFMGGVYVDRMGFVHFINEMFQQAESPWCPELEDQLEFYGTSTTIYVGGRTRIDKGELSIHDFIYQRI